MSCVCRPLKSKRAVSAKCEGTTFCSERNMLSMRPGNWRWLAAPPVSTTKVLTGRTTAETGCAGAATGGAKGPSKSGGAAYGSAVKPAPPGYVLATKVGLEAGVSRRSLSRAILDGKLKAVRAGTGEVFIDEASFKAWLDARNTLTPIEPSKSKTDDKEPNP